MPAHLRAEPKRLLMDVTFTADGGDIRNDKIAAIRKAVLATFDGAAAEQGIGRGFTIIARSVSPARFDLMCSKKGISS